MPPRHISNETESRGVAIDAQSSGATIIVEEAQTMLLRVRNLLMVVAFGWWTTSLVTMDPLMFEWVAYLFGV